MKNIKRIIIALIVLTALVVISCEVSSILLSEDIRTSQPRNDIRWKNITIVPTTTTTGDTTTVDAAVLISARGVHVFYHAQNPNGGVPLSYGDLTKPTFANDKDNYGIFYDCYVPGNYNSDSSAYVILTASKPKPGAEIQYYVLDLKKLIQHKDEPAQVKTALSLVAEGVTSLSASDAHDKEYGIKKSSAINSDYLLYRGKFNSNETVYCLGRMNVERVSDSYKITLSTEKSFKAPNNVDEVEIKGIDRIWENKQGDRAVVKYTKHQNDVKSYEKYATVKLADNQNASEDNRPQLIKELSNDDDNMHFDHFFVYEDITDAGSTKLAWMGIRTDGRVYHSHSTGSNLVCNGNFSYDRYSPIASLYISDDEKAIDGGEVGLSLLSRNSSTGFIITSFRKMPGTDNKSIIHQEESSITTGFAEDFRSEDIAVFGYFKENPVNGSNQHLVVLSVEVGAETYHIDSSKPSLIKTNTSVARDKIDLPYATLAP